MNCARCGAPLENGAPFCPNCGEIQQTPDYGTISPVPPQPAPGVYSDPTGAPVNQQAQPYSQPPQDQSFGQQPQQPFSPAPPPQDMGQQPQPFGQPQDPYGQTQQQPYVQQPQQPYGQPAQPYGQQPYTQPPKKSSKKLFIIIGVIVVVLIAVGVAAFLILGNNSGGGDTPPPVATDPVVPSNPGDNSGDPGPAPTDPTPPPTPPSGGAAETISGDVTGVVGKLYATKWFTFTVESMLRDSATAKHVSPEGYTMVEVEITITNTSGSSQPFGTFDWFVDDDTLTDYIYPLELNEYDPMYMPSQFTLANGESATYLVVIEFPKDLPNPYFMYIEADDSGNTYSTFRIPIPQER